MWEGEREEDRQRQRQRQRRDTIDGREVGTGLDEEDKMEQPEQGWRFKVHKSCVVEEGPEVEGCNIEGMVKMDGIIE